MEMEYFIKWNKFTDDILYNNRFFSKCELLDEIKTVLLKQEMFLNKNMELYRGRIYVTDDYNENFAITSARSQHSQNSDQFHIKVSNNVLKDGNIWGYTKEESGMPPRNQTKDGRANPKYIPYFYLANNIETCLIESRANLKTPVSIATYRINKSKRIAQCSIDKESSKKLSDFEQFLLQNIHSALSHPAESDKDYIISQYISEVAKLLGFDGISFKSSRLNGGINYTFYNDYYFEFLGSEIHEISDIKIVSRKLLPPKYISSNV